MESKKLQIICKSLELFQCYGIKSISMDDISSKMSMSKKTLYNYFKDKKDLVGTTLSYNFNCTAEKAEELINQKLNAIDHILSHIEFIEEIHATNSPVMIFDLQKYYPEEYQLMRSKRKEKISEFHMNNMAQGIKEGLYRKNINTEVVPKIIIVLNEIIIENDIITFEEAFSPGFIREMFIYHLHGIVSSKGLEYLNKKLNKK